MWNRNDQIRSPQQRSVQQAEQQDTSRRVSCKEEKYKVGQLFDSTEALHLFQWAIIYKVVMKPELYLVK